MSCTTILVGKKASYDGSTMIARNDDAGSGHFTEKKFIAVSPMEQPVEYTSVLSHVQIRLPDNPMWYTCVPNVLKDEGIWAAAGANEANVAMSATETITANDRVLGADPLVELIPASGGRPEQPGGIGEEDLVVLVLPYIHSAREGVLRLGQLLEEYGTYEKNAIAFQDVNEIWWMETIGGHHWIARRVPDECYVVMPNQLGLDEFNLEDALGEGKDYLCSRDMRSFIEKNHLDLSLDGRLNPRDAFGTHDDSDHVYNTPRAWYGQRFFNPRSEVWDGADADHTPLDDDLPWCRIPERKITVEDVKYVLSAHFQGTPYDPYARFGDPALRGMYRPIGISRTSFLALLQIRPYAPEAIRTVEWLAYGCNVFNAFVPFYTNIHRTPEYLANTTATVDTGSFYWANRLIAAMADPHFNICAPHIERYQSAVQSQGHHLIGAGDDQYLAAQPSCGASDDLSAEDKEKCMSSAVQHCEEVNDLIAEMAKTETDKVLGHILYEASCLMKNSYARSDG